MEDIIDIIVTETTNLIEITSQPTDEVIDVNIIDNREDITLNVTPSVVEININSLTGNFGVNWGDINGTLSNQTDLQNALNLKADLVDGKVPSSQLPSYVDDVIEVATYSALPATGEVGKIYVVLDTNLIYRWSGSAYIEIKDSSAVWGAITGTLSSQTDLQSALDAKFDNPIGDTTQYIAGDGSLITFPVAGQAGTLVREVRNTTGATLTKGTIVYISGATGNKPTVSKAIATGDSTSAQTFGMCQADISNNSNGYVVCVGDITGLDTSAVSEGVQLYLSSTTAGTYTTTKQVAPAHLVYIGVVTRSHPTQGQIEVKIQNGYELDEIHDVAISSVANNQGLFYESSTSLWKNKSIATVLGYTPANGANYLPLTGGTLTGTLIGTRAEFTTSTLVDGVLVNNGSGRGIRIINAGAGYGLIINNETASSAIPFVIQKSGLDKIYFTDSGAGNFSSSLTASSFVKSGGTSSQFLKADGSVDTSTYALNSEVVHLTGSETITGLKYFFSGTKNDLLFVSETVGYASQTGYSHFKANTNHVEFINSTNTKSTKFIHGNGAYEFTMPNASGTIALTSNLSSYLPLSGGTLTGALSGTSASLTSTGVYVLSLNNTAQDTRMEWQVNGTQTFQISSSASQVNLYGSTNIPMLFYTNGSERMRITSSGNVGIGTTSPSYMLDVVKAGVNTIRVYNTANDADAYLQVQNTGGNALFGINNVGPYIYTGSALALQLWTNGAERVRLTSGGNVGIGTTSPNNKLQIGDTSYTLNEFAIGNGSVNFAIDLTSTNTDIYSSGALTFNTALSERMRITSGGNVLIGTTTELAKVTIKGQGSTGDTFALKITDSAGSLSFAVRNDTLVQTPGVYGYAYASTANVFVQSDGYLGRNTSSLKYKHNVENYNRGLNDVLNLRPVLYESKNPSETGKKFTGFIAEEVHELGLTEFVQYATDGTPDALQYPHFVALLTKAVQEQQVQIQELKQQLANK